jgi:magnesium chelatase family protein
LRASRNNKGGTTVSLSLVQSRVLVGLRTAAVTVEVHLANGLPSFTLVGLADTEVKESRERVRSALQNCGLEFPHNKRITVNLAPADLPKDSGRFDLPIAMGILAASGQVDAAKLAGHEFAGELSLSGELRPVRGALAMTVALHADGLATRLVLPAGSAEEAALVPGAQVYRARHLLDVVRAFPPEGSDGTGAQDAPNEGWSRVEAAPPAVSPRYPDMADVKGQAAARRALEIAAAGGHSLLMVGPPGAGKSMLAQRFAGLLPAMDVQEALESAAIASLAGQFSLERWFTRATHAPHHTASAAALVGGGSPPLRATKVLRAQAPDKSTTYNGRIRNCLKRSFRIACPEDSACMPPIRVHPWPQSSHMAAPRGATQASGFRLAAQNAVLGRQLDQLLAEAEKNCHPRYAPGV